MYRRRRPQRELIAFSFDSFLDVVANLIGIIIRLILVAWVGARTYHAAMAIVEEELPAMVQQSPPSPKADEDPLNEQINQAHRDLDALRKRLLEKMNQLEGVQAQVKGQRQALGQLASRRQELSQADQKLEQGETTVLNLQPPLELDELRQRSQELTQAMKKLENAPSRKQVLRYQTPVSRAVEGEELFFECKAGRVTFIDLNAFIQEMETRRDELDQILKTQWTANATTATIGAFRLRFTRERLPEPGENPTGKPRGLFFRSGYTEWEVEPVAPQRGETAVEALKSESAFRQLVDGLDANHTVVTMWVYPDSFALYRTLRDYLQAHDLEVAGRPLPQDIPIRASKYGSRSRGQ